MKTFMEPLPPEKEQYYLRKYKEGDQEARNILVEHNMRLVAHIVKKYAGVERDMEDLISIGTVGLIKAINTFDMDKGNKLATYSAKCIDNELLMLMRAEKKKSKEVSLYEPIGTDKEGNVISLLDVMESKEKDVLDSCQFKENIRWLYQSMESALTPREQMIIRKRYGLMGEKEVTQRELAKELGISRSYVSRIEKKCLQKLKNCY